MYELNPFRPARWLSHYKRIHDHRYCGGYKKSAFNHRTIESCGKWVRSVDKEAKHFFYRLNSNFHCSPCPMYYTGSTAHTHGDNSYMFIYSIINWTPPHYKWQRTYTRIAFHRYCTGYKKTSHGYRTVEACGKWVSQVDPEARYFFFREQSNWHCSPCPLHYTGHPTTGTAVDNNTRIFIYKINNWKQPTYEWSDKYVRRHIHRYCTGYKKTMTHTRTVAKCGEWVRNVDPNARYFFFRK
jgi:hypothetical protein